MPTVHVSGGFRVRILLPPREHGPPHVHVTHAGTEVVIVLPQGSQSAEVRTVYGMKTADIVAAFRLVEANAEMLLDAWRKYHG